MAHLLITWNELKELNKKHKINKIQANDCLMKANQRENNLIDSEKVYEGTGQKQIEEVRTLHKDNKTCEK